MYYKKQEQKGLPCKDLQSQSDDAGRRCGIGMQNKAPRYGGRADEGPPLYFLPFDE